MLTTTTGAHSALVNICSSIFNDYKNTYNFTNVIILVVAIIGFTLFTLNGIFRYHRLLKNYTCFNDGQIDKQHWKFVIIRRFKLLLLLKTDDNSSKNLNDDFLLKFSNNSFGILNYTIIIYTILYTFISIQHSYFLWIYHVFDSIIANATTNILLIIHFLCSLLLFLVYVFNHYKLTLYNPIRKIKQINSVELINEDVANKGILIININQANYEKIVNAYPGFVSVVHKHYLHKYVIMPLVSYYITTVAFILAIYIPFIDFDAKMQHIKILIQPEVTIYYMISFIYIIMLFISLYAFRQVLVSSNIFDKIYNLLHDDE